MNRLKVATGPALEFLGKIEQRLRCAAIGNLPREATAPVCLLAQDLFSCPGFFRHSVDPRLPLVAWSALRTIP